MSPVASAPIAGGGALVAGQLVPPEIAERVLMIEGGIPSTIN
jgi:hypothetical protein